jgi:hypothetical protein
MSEIYRKAALERLSSPEELDSLMQVTTPKGWLALFSLGALILIALLWGIFGRIPTKVSGQGIILERMGDTASDLEAVVYLSPIDGKRVRPGMKILISPTSTRQEESGSILGIVSRVSEFPATPQEMMRTLQNEKLVEALSSVSAPIEIRADLTPDPSTKTGYRWSSGKGPAMKIASRTQCHAAVIVEEQSPVSLAIPFLSGLIAWDGDEDGTKGIR